MNKKLTPGKIYYWQDIDRIIGAMRIKMENFDEIFGYGFIIEDSDLLKDAMKKKGKDTNKNFSVLNRNRAVTQVKICLTNVYNALRVHGKGILNDKGDIDVEKYVLAEKKLSVSKGFFIDNNMLYPHVEMKKFNSEEITFKKAMELELT
jgi:hypothetical protein